MSHLRFCQSFALNRSSKEHFCTSQHKKASNVISNPRNSTCLIPFIFATINGIITVSYFTKDTLCMTRIYFREKICSRWVKNVTGAKRVQKLRRSGCGCTVRWQHSHYPPWCRPRSWYHLHSSVCWAQPSPADSAETWEHRHTEERQSEEQRTLEETSQQNFAFWNRFHSRVCLTSNWTRCSRFLYVFWTSSLVPSTPYHIMFLVRLLQEETAEGRANQHWFCLSTIKLNFWEILFCRHE